MHDYILGEIHEKAKTSKFTGKYVNVLEYLYIISC